MSTHGIYGQLVENDGKALMGLLQMRVKAEREELVHMTRAVAAKAPKRSRQQSESDAVARRNSFVLIQGGARSDCDKR